MSPAEAEFYTDYNYFAQHKLLGLLKLDPSALPLSTDHLNFLVTWLREVAQDLETMNAPSDQYLFLARRPEPWPKSQPRKVRKGGV